MRFAEAQEAMTAFNRTEDASAFDAWVRAEDREVRARIERGVEDSISNLILYGTSFTGLARAESAEAAATSAGELVDLARARAFGCCRAGASCGERTVAVRARFSVASRPTAEGDGGVSGDQSCAVRPRAARIPGKTEIAP